eukprot:TRINITY_DN770_c0_g1_i2.p1 TRINITY_DN770_c0_g1~~TRINITY_DN770_c0_g1_i2.p1  ORF type:complete len:585 (+),score=148.97 TRINITY_DN770_c0_g1_i2:112-1866(+)
MDDTTESEFHPGSPTSREICNEMIESAYDFSFSPKSDRSPTALTQSSEDNFLGALTNAYDEKRTMLAMFIIEHFYHTNNPQLFAHFVEQLYQRGLLEDFNPTSFPQYKQAYLSYFKNVLNEALGKAKALEGKPVSSEMQNQLTTLRDSLDSMIISRYRKDFVELNPIGNGGYGSVFKVQHRLDGCCYAIKKIRFKDKGQRTDEKLREIKLLAKLDHSNICRYFQAWIEPASEDRTPLRRNTSIQELSLVDSSISQSESHSRTWRRSDLSSSSIIFDQNSEQSLSQSHSTFDAGTSSSGTGAGPQNDLMLVPYRGIDPVHQNMEYILYIQMQLYETSTLKEWLSNPRRKIDDSKNLFMFHQIIEGLNTIHSQGIFHRDMKPANIFLAQDGNIKIGDFGLAKAFECDQSIGSSSSSISDIDDDLFDARADDPGCDVDAHAEVECDGCSEHTVGVGTATYAAPEQMNHHRYDFQVDIYSVGIILFEMYNVFTTGSERIQVLKNLKMGIIPIEFSRRFPDQSRMITWCMSQDPKKRPTARQILSDVIFDSQNVCETVFNLRAELKETKDKLKEQQELILQLENKLKGL